MDAKKELTIEEKLDLIRSRAVRFGLKRHDLEDAVQDVTIDLLEFTPDPEKMNGASESTVLIAVIDRRLMEWLRTQKRYQDLVDRCGAMLPSDDVLLSESSIEASDTALDVATVLAGLPEFERQVGQMLSEGHNATSIARELGVKRPFVCEAMTAIRERFTSAGLGGEELA
ncbi:sigma-70 family RNA polymerase sigma factor [Planctomicrobium sp. SH661]|uniref:sigma-70 family RNA polymerase sigma factor n=1 Tax=Planctomicrobium sp. SH661 TaxID=3448124 RepID=UPI003F5C23CC